MSKESIKQTIDEFRTLSKGQVVLVLQGGGALGAYQVGVYQALHEAGVELDWIVGTSIGAINAAIIAGNVFAERLNRLEEFWRRMQRPSVWPFASAWPALAEPWNYLPIFIDGIPGFFKPNLQALWSAGVPSDVNNAAFYTTEALRETIADLVDFTIINCGAPRFTIGAANVQTSMMYYFDSRDMPIAAEHIMASGALPPAFPAIDIEGQFYWDGGILSNTPTEVIFDDIPRHNSLIFSVHLWNPNGPVPRSILEALHRQKDIQYSSRIASHAARQQQAHRLRHVISQLVEQIPTEQRKNDFVRELAGYGCKTQMHVVRLLVPRIENESHTKDIDFSPSGIRARREAGHTATWRALERAPWRGEFNPIEGVILHDEMELQSAAE
jgi:NTE family protein